MQHVERHPGVAASGAALLVVALAYLSGLVAWFGTARVLYVSVIAALVGGAIAGAHTDLLRVGFPPGFLAFLLASLGFEPTGLVSLGALAAVAQYILPVAVLAGCVSGIVAVLLDHHVLGAEEGSGDDTAPE